MKAGARKNAASAREAMAMAKLATTSTTQSISKASAAVRIALIEVVVALGCTGWACVPVAVELVEIRLAHSHTLVHGLWVTAQGITRARMIK